MRLIMKVLFIIGIIIVLVVNSLFVCVNFNFYKDKLFFLGIEKKYEWIGELLLGWEKKLVVGNCLDCDIYNYVCIIVFLGEDGLVIVCIENKVVCFI